MMDYHKWCYQMKQFIGLANFSHVSSRMAQLYHRLPWWIYPLIPVWRIVVIFIYSIFSFSVLFLLCLDLLAVTASYADGSTSVTTMAPRTMSIIHTTSSTTTTSLSCLITSWFTKRVTTVLESLWMSANPILL